MIDTIYIHVTKRCNLNCLYCYFSPGRAMEHELLTKEFIAVLEDVVLLRPKRLIFTGGEPLLRKDLFKLAQSFREMASGVCLGLSTNGMLINQVNAKEITDCFDEVRISIDGFQETNDLLRGKDSFQKTMQAFRYILDEGGDPAAHITVTSINLASVKEFMPFLLRKGIVKLHLSPLKLAGRAMDGKISIGFEKIKSLVAEFWQETFGLQMKSGGEEKINCGIGRFLSINPDGSVYPCHVLSFPEFCLGNVRDDALFSIFHNSPLIQKMQNLHFSKITRCMDCAQESSQDGTCLGIHAQEAHHIMQLLQAIK